MAIAAMAIAASGAFGPAWGQAHVTVQTGAYAGQMTVPLNKSQVLRVDRPFSQIAVGNAAIADVMPVTNQTIYVLGKKTGTTNLTIYGTNKSLLAVVDLVVTNDADGLKVELHELLPGERIEVRAVGDTLILSGVVSSAPAAQKAVAIAERFAPGHVLNQMGVKGSQQVLLQVRISEIKRSLSDELGLRPNLQLGNPKGRNFFTFTSNPSAAAGTAFANAILTVGSPWYSLVENIDLLENKGLVKTLAEPDLLALSGQTASFLAGGEFPVPVAQTGSTAGGAAAITVEFKQFGVTLAFTPTVLDGGLINLVVSPEVSALDKTTGTSVNGTTVPGLTTRRASTTIELHDGEGFAIAGLLENDINNAINQIPGLGQVPILGGLFRDTSFQRNETELVIIVIPHLVKPAPPTALRAPTDTFVPASEPDAYVFGRVEAPESGFVEPGQAGGLSGPYGHILR